MKKAIWTIIIIAVVLLGVYAIAQMGDDTEIGERDRDALVLIAQQAGLEITEDSILVDLREQDDSGVEGVAVLTELENNQTRVAAWLDDADGNSRPIHIHAGSCANLGSVLHPLSNVVDGFSNSSLAVTFAGLEADAPLAINAHESANAIENNIACGNIDFDQTGDDDDMDDDDDDTATTTDDDDDDTTADDDDDTGATATVRYTDSGFSPAELLVARGTTVTFVNESSGQMWVASAQHPTHDVLPAFDQLTAVAVGGDYEFTFDEAGTWPFHNHVSANHTGRIVVQ